MRARDQHQDQNLQRFVPVIRASQPDRTRIDVLIDGASRGSELQFSADGRMQPKRIDSIDGLRAFAVTAVFLCHARWLAGGFVGVQIFFVLSGYLISSIIFNEMDETGKISLRDFYVRRTIRLLPALLGVLAVFSFYDLAFHTKSISSPSMTALPYVLGYVGNWYQVMHGVDSLGLWGHTWTLAVEEQFYLAWPLIVVVAARFGRRAISWVAASLFLCGTVWRLFLAASGASFARARGTDFCIDALMLGCLLASLSPQARVAVSKVAVRAWPLATLWLVYICVNPSLNLFVSGVQQSISAIASAALVMTLTESSGFLSRALALRPLVGLGRISYGAYLWHLPAILALEGHIQNPVLMTLVVAVVTVVAAYCSWIVIEKPALRLRKVFCAPSRPAQLEAAPARTY